jgi:hypothetical protein
MAYLGNFDQTSQHGAAYRRMLTTNEDADRLLAAERDKWIQMRLGDGTQDAHYSDIVKFLKFGGYTPTQGDPNAAQLQDARGSFEEMDSAYSKTSGNGSVSNVRAARDQFFSKHRG